MSEMSFQLTFKQQLQIELPVKKSQLELDG